MPNIVKNIYSTGIELVSSLHILAEDIFLDVKRTLTHLAPATLKSDLDLYMCPSLPFLVFPTQNFAR